MTTEIRLGLTLTAKGFRLALPVIAQLREKGVGFLIAQTGGDRCVTVANAHLFEPGVPG